MKKLLSALLYLLIISTTQAQIYTSLGWQNKGATLGIGALYKHIDVSFLYDADFTKQGEKNISFNLGRQFNLSNWGEDDWIVTPIIGIVNTYSKTYNACKYIPPVNHLFTRPVYGFEFGENIMDGRFAFVYKHSDTDHYGVTIRVFIIQLVKTNRPWRK